VLFQYGLNNPFSTLGVIDVSTGKKVEILKHPRYRLYRGHFSPDDRWVVFHADDPGRETREFIAPFHSKPSDESEWIAVTDGTVWTDAPRWSPDGNFIYYFSDLDGSRCIWAQRLDTATKRPIGQPVAIEHLHNRQHSSLSVNVNALDLAVARDKIIFSLGEVRGNLWMLDRP
jgi:Tol biopolymer transport system component